MIVPRSRTTHSHTDDTNTIATITTAAAAAAALDAATGVPFAGSEPHGREHGTGFLHDWVLQLVDTDGNVRHTFAPAALSRFQRYELTTPMLSPPTQFRLHTQVPSSCCVTQPRSSCS